MTNKKSARDWAIFMNINDERYSDVERMTAIEHIAYVPTHNSITKAMMLDVIRYLLTAQKPRVLTLEEATGEDECWFEFRPSNMGRYADCYLHDNPDRTRVYFTGKAVMSLFDNADYGKTWRCWTARPTDEQRETVKWND